MSTLNLAKYFITLVTAMVPMARPGSYRFIWGEYAIPLQVAFMIVLIVACYVDLVLGLVLASIPVALAIQIDQK